MTRFGSKEAHIGSSAKNDPVAPVSGPKTYPLCTEPHGAMYRPSIFFFAGLLTFCALANGQFNPPPQPPYVETNQFPQIPISLKASAGFVAVGSFNGDSIPDIAVANHAGNTITLILSNGAGGYTESTTYSVGNEPTSIAVADFNGDGYQDIAVAADDGSLTLLLTNCAP